MYYKLFETKIDVLNFFKNSELRLEYKILKLLLVGTLVILMKYLTASLKKMNKKVRYW